MIQRASAAAGNDPRARRRRGFALAAAVWLAALYGTTPFLREILATLKDALGAAFSPAVTGAVTLVGAGLLAAYRARLRCLGPRRLSALAALLGAFAVAMAVLPWPEERVHLVQYGLLAVWVTEWRRAAARKETWRVHATALLLVMAAGVGDELIQALLPSRVGDPRDVLLNWVAALLTQALLALLAAPGDAPRKADGGAR